MRVNLLSNETIHTFTQHHGYWQTVIANPCALLQLINSTECVNGHKIINDQTNAETYK